MSFISGKEDLRRMADALAESDPLKHRKRQSLVVIDEPGGNVSSRFAKARLAVHRGMELKRARREQQYA